MRTLSQDVVEHIERNSLAPELGPAPTPAASPAAPQRPQPQPRARRSRWLARSLVGIPVAAILCMVGLALAKGAGQPWGAPLGFGALSIALALVLVGHGKTVTGEEPAELGEDSDGATRSEAPREPRDL